MAAEVIHDHHVARAERRDENPVDIGLEDRAVHRPVDQHGRLDAGEAQAGDEGGGPPVSVRHAHAQSLTAGRPPAKPRHLRVQPGFVDEDQALGIEIGLSLEPGPPGGRHIRSRLLIGVPGLF